VPDVLSEILAETLPVDRNFKRVRCPFAGRYEVARLPRILSSASTTADG
jgi:hypothetical protein